MSQYEDLLTKAATEGLCDSEQWPSAFPHILSRLEHNVFNAFTIPKIRPPPNAPPISADALPNSTGPADSSSTGPPPASSPPPVPEPSQQTAPAPPISPPAGTLPPPLSATYNFITTSLRTHFPHKPPHTLQRLAELLLHPRAHHNFLFSYLNALDRVVCVSSTLDVFPLPDDDRPAATGPLVNGASHALSSSSSTFGGDDTLGGALLTPIPWLRPGTSPIDDDDNGHASPSPVTSPLSVRSDLSPGADAHDALDADSKTSPTREAGGVTQGELLRAEQQASAPPAPVTSLSGAATTGRAVSPSGGDEEEVPHARGPEAIGMEDTGPQTKHGDEKPLDLEAAVGRKQPHGHDGADEEEGERIEVEAGEEEKRRRDGDGDTVVTDVDGRTEEDKEKHGEGEDLAALGRDTTAG